MHTEVYMYTYAYAKEFNVELCQLTLTDSVA